MAQVIHRVFDPVQLKSCVIAGKLQNCYIRLFLRNKMERKVTNPIMYLPRYFVKLNPECEVQGFSILALWQKDNAVFSFEFFISKETGIYHIYIGGYRLQNVEKFGLTKTSRYDQIFIDSIALIAEKLRPFCSISPGSTVPKRHKWFNLLSTSAKMTFTSYHSHKCLVLMPFISKPGNVTCHHCKHD